MGYISKYDRTFLSFISRKYNDYRVRFEFFDDYVLWLFYDYSKENEEFYYRQLEDDLKDYVKFQNGKERDWRGRLNGDWEKD